MEQVLNFLRGKEITLLSAILLKGNNNNNTLKLGYVTLLGMPYLQFFLKLTRV